MIGQRRAEARGSQRGAYEVREGWYQPSSQAKRNRLYLLWADVVSSSQMRRMRAHRLRGGPLARCAAGRLAWGVDRRLHRDWRFGEMLSE